MRSVSRVPRTVSQETLLATAPWYKQSKEMNSVNINKRIAALSFMVIAALGYLGLSGINLFLNPAPAKANTAPSSAYERISMGHSDYIWNWDYKDDELDRTQVDWGMRFVFEDNADVNYVKDRLDGRYHDPSISPNLNNVLAGWKYAHIDDGPEHVGSYWDSDKGLKNSPGCNWNFGHMRFYANSDTNYNPTLGYYVVASLHRDHEALYCDNQFTSLESDEDVWVDRIEDNLGPDTDYNWVVSDYGTYWRNRVMPEDDIGGGNHAYESDGWGVNVEVPGDN